MNMKFKLHLRKMCREVSVKTIQKVFARNSYVMGKVQALKASHVMGLEVGHGCVKAPLGNRMFVIEW